MDLILIICILLAGYSAVYFAYKVLAKKNSNQISCEDKSSEMIVYQIKSNNNYPPVLNVFESLSEKLSQRGMILHADLRGYLDDGKAK